MTQKEMIKKHMESGFTLTPLEALRFYNCFRLADVVFKLKKDGMDIITNLVEDNGKTFAEYHLRRHNA